VHTLGESLDSNEIRHKVAANMAKHEVGVPEAPASAIDMRRAGSDQGIDAGDCVASMSRRPPPAEEIVSALLNSWAEVLALTC
jgi:hypothetical protein